VKHSFFSEIEKERIFEAYFSSEKRETYL